MPTIKLQSSDGDTFDVDISIAKQSGTISTMLEVGNIIPVHFSYTYFWCNSNVQFM